MDERTSKFRRDLTRDADAGVTMTAELISAVVVWTGIGWLIDRWLDTDPWITVCGAVLGFALGMWLVFLRAAAQGKAEDAKRSRL